MIKHCYSFLIFSCFEEMISLHCNTSVTEFRCFLFTHSIFVIQGNILYRFPSLQRTASSERSRRKEYVGRKWADWVGGVEKFFKEKKWQFRFYIAFVVTIWSVLL